MKKTTQSIGYIRIIAEVQRHAIVIVTLLIGFVIGSILNLNSIKTSFASSQLRRQSFQADINSIATPESFVITITGFDSKALIRTITTVTFPIDRDKKIYLANPATIEISTTLQAVPNIRVMHVEYRIGDKTVVANNAPDYKVNFEISDLPAGEYPFQVRIVNSGDVQSITSEPLLIHINRTITLDNIEPSMLGGANFVALVLLAGAISLIIYVSWNPRFRRRITQIAGNVGTSIGTRIWGGGNSDDSTPKARLERVGGRNTSPESVDLFGGINKVGRSSANSTIQINDPHISRLHCRIEERNGTFWVYDEGSANGTKVNEQRVKDTGQMLQPGSIIDMGSVKYRFELLSAPTSAMLYEDAVTQVETGNSGVTEPYEPSAWDGAEKYDNCNTDPTVTDIPNETKTNQRQYDKSKLSSRIDEPNDSKDVINRYPNISLPNRATINQECVVRIAITEKPAREEFARVAMLLDTTSAQTVVVDEVEIKSVQVDILISAEDFEVLGASHYTLDVPLIGDSLPCLIKLKPISIGEKKINIEFFQNSRYVGRIQLSISVNNDNDVPVLVDTVNVRSNIQLNGNALAPDLQILITENKSVETHLRYTFKLHSPKCGLYFHTIHEELTFSGSPSKWISSLYKELIKLPLESDAEDIRETLNTIGADLYDKLFPQELKDLWIKSLRKRVQSIMIISDEPWIPWEIVRPSFEDESGEIREDGFLCEDYWLTRWLAGPTPPSKITIRQGALVSPAATSLPSSLLESNFLIGLGMVTAVEPSLAAVRKLLSSGGYELLHFACHGSFDPESNEQSIIYLQGRDALKTRDISGERRNFRKDTPLIFVNACCTARADFSLVGIGSWADKFIRENASGFIGSAWEVNDETAYKFSKTLYERLFEGETIGASLQAARLAIKEEPDSTWLAYTIYADPLATVEFIK